MSTADAYADYTEVELVYYRDGFNVMEQRSRQRQVLAYTAIDDCVIA